MKACERVKEWTINLKCEEGGHGMAGGGEGRQVRQDRSAHQHRYGTRRFSAKAAPRQSPERAPQYVTQMARQRQGGSVRVAGRFQSWRMVALYAVVKRGRRAATPWRCAYVCHSIEQRAQRPPPFNPRRCPCRASAACARHGAKCREEDHSVRDAE